MARARNIKPGFFRNADLVELPVETRLLFAGLWTLADRDGRIADRPKQIKMEIYPADSFDVESMLEALHDAGFILRYEVNGIKCIEVQNFLKHQNPHHAEKPSLLPAPVLPRVSPGLNVLIPESLILNPESGGTRQRGATTVGPRLAETADDPPPTEPDPGAEHERPVETDEPAEPDPLTEPSEENPPPEENPQPGALHADAITARSVAIAVLLRQRGAGVAAGDVRLRGWAERGIGDAALLTALERAERQRERSRSAQPVNAGLLDAMLSGNAGGAPPARASPAQQRTDWVRQACPGFAAQSEPQGETHGNCSTGAVVVDAVASRVG